FATDGGGDPDAGDSGNWAAADDVAGDIVLTQTERQYDDDGNVIFTITKDRFHNATHTQTGELGSATHSLTGTIAPARASYAESYYDALNRLTGTAVLGTAGGSVLTSRPDATLPARSGTKLASSYEYDAAGKLFKVIDPRGIESRTFYDAMGRSTRTIEGYTNGTPTDSSNRITDYTYDGASHTVTAKAVLPDSAHQTTRYEYGVTSAGGSGIDSNDVLHAVYLPNPSSGNASTSARETYTVNALGQRISKTDANTTAHAYSYDVIGRLTSDAVTTLGGVDGSVRRLETGYDSAGRPYLFTSYSAATGGTVVNQVERVYNGFGQLITESQSHSGVVGSLSPMVQYVYSEAEGDANHSRLKRIIYPNGRIVRYEYSSGIDNAISRLSFLSDDTSGSPTPHLEEYKYLGLSTVINRYHEQPDVELTYIKQGSESVGDAGDQYAGLDRFGRIVDQRWRNRTSGVHTERFTYLYDADSNRLNRDNLLNPVLTEWYQYDRLNRLVERMIVGNDPYDRVQQLDLWDYDALGNIKSTSRTLLAVLGDGNLDGIVDANDYGTIDSNLEEGITWWRLGDFTLDALTDGDDYLAIDTHLDQTGGAEVFTFRTHNAQNQLTDYDGNDIGYDANGNMTGVENGRSSTYDAWGRLISAATATFEYDALGRRIQEDFSSSVPDKDLYYSDQWQVLEERESGTPRRQYVWSPVYVDAMVLRDDDSDSNGSLDRRLYVQQDANFNVTALMGTSGDVVERYVYEPFGEATVIDDDWSSDTDGLTDVGWVYLHQGGRWDTETKLYSFRHRDYDPKLVRWTEQDPAGYRDGLSLYQYERSDPTGLLDPMGLAGMSLKNGGAAVLGSGGGGGAVAIENAQEGRGAQRLQQATTKPATDKSGATTGPTSGPTASDCEQDKKDAVNKKTINCRRWAFNHPNIGRKLDLSSAIDAGILPKGATEDDALKDAKILTKVIEAELADARSSVRGVKAQLTDPVPPGHHMICVYWRGNWNTGLQGKDFHFATKDDDGRWSEKESEDNITERVKNPLSNNGTVCGCYIIDSPPRCAAATK
ncbi:MAG TPA: RHS repeat-associated core domain-containing protein, partial [Tepidisphaeraceae bacterium]